jgi:hypothetical protein
VNARAGHPLNLPEPTHRRNGWPIPPDGDWLRSDARGILASRRLGTALPGMMHAISTTTTSSCWRRERKATQRCSPWPLQPGGIERPLTARGADSQATFPGSRLLSSLPPCRRDQGLRPSPQHPWPDQRFHATTQGRSPVR